MASFDDADHVDQYVKYARVSAIGGFLIYPAWSWIYQHFMPIPVDDPFWERFLLGCYPLITFFLSYSRRFIPYLNLAIQIFIYLAIAQLFWLCSRNHMHPAYLMGNLAAIAVVTPYFTTNKSMICFFSFVVALSLAIALKSFQPVDTIFYAAIFSILTLSSIALYSKLVTLNSLEQRKKEMESDLKAASDQLIQTDKLATFGTLAAGIAHDISNPNNLILVGQTDARKHAEYLKQLFSDLIGEDNSPEELIVKQEFDREFAGLFTNLKEIELGANRIREINTAIRNQTRTDLGLESFDLRPLIEECLLVTKSRLMGVDCHIQCPAEATLVGRRSQIGQVLMNLIANAGDAMNEHSKGEKKLLISCTRADNDNLVLSVEDSGPGIPDEQRKKVLEKFYTTKQLGKGTGLGLSIVVQILNEHRAELSILSSPELGGAQFRIEFPAQSTFPS